MGRNGHRREDENAAGNAAGNAGDDWRDTARVARGGLSLASVGPVLLKGAHALLDTANALEDISTQVESVTRDTAKALSETAEMKRHLINITAREQLLCKQLNELKLFISPKSTSKRHRKRKKR